MLIPLPSDFDDDSAGRWQELYADLDTKIEGEGLDLILRQITAPQVTLKYVAGLNIKEEYRHRQPRCVLEIKSSSDTTPSGCRSESDLDAGSRT